MILLLVLLYFWFVLISFLFLTPVVYKYITLLLFPWISFLFFFCGFVRILLFVCFGFHKLPNFSLVAVQIYSLLFSLFEMFCFHKLRLVCTGIHPAIHFFFLFNLSFLFLLVVWMLFSFICLF